MKKKKSRAYHRNQKGAGSTDWVQSFHAFSADPSQLSRFTLNNIDRAPMFNPLQTNTIFPTGTTGIIPTGSYYLTTAPVTVSNSLGPPTPGFIQMGGRKGTKTGAKKNPWVTHVRQFAKSNGLTYAQALQDPQVKDGYVKVGKK